MSSISSFPGTQSLRPGYNNKCDCSKTNGLIEVNVVFFNKKPHINFIYSADLTFRIIRIIDFNMLQN